VKLWTVYPRLFRVPPIASAAQAVERVLVALLVGGAIFLLVTGVMTTAQWVPWEFRFRQTHFFTAWIVIGALVAHIGAKLAITRHALGGEARAQATAADAERARAGLLTRRGLIASAFAGAGVVALTTGGQTFAPARDLALLAPRRTGVGPQGLPVNRTARAAGVLERARAADWALVVEGDVARALRLSRDELAALPQHEVELPIACVEGWSTSARWTGVPVRDLLARAGAPAGARVAVESLERGGLHRSELNPEQAAHPDTLLALAIAGEPLHLDHGYPCRLVGPNRPGVQQTKWVTRVEVTRA
jgi:DMSO/TMAO reductase YedYZ molybdopterin-dependent catalytic subunit